VYPNAEEIEEIIARYQTLRNARNDLMMACEKQNDEILKRRKSYIQMKNTSQNQLLIQSGILNAYRSELENLLNVLKTEQDENEILEDTKKDIIREYSQINQAIRNIFGRCQVVNSNNSIGNNNNSTNAVGKNQMMKLANTASSSNIFEQHNKSSNAAGIANASASSSKMTSEAEKEKLLLYLEFVQNKVMDLQEIKNEYNTPENLSKYAHNKDKESANKDNRDRAAVAVVSKSKSLAEKSTISVKTNTSSGTSRID
jgi:hypothetical protein